jgi:hypothetical protein
LVNENSMNGILERALHAAQLDQVAIGRPDELGQPRAPRLPEVGGVEDQVLDRGERPVQVGPLRDHRDPLLDLAALAEAGDLDKRRAAH